MRRDDGHTVVAALEDGIGVGSANAMQLTVDQVLLSRSARRLPWRVDLHG